MARIHGRGPTVVDGVVALVAFALTLGMLIGRGFDDEARDPDALGFVLAGLASLPLLARRRAPLGVFASTALASSLMSGLDYAHGPPIGATVALFFLALSPDSSRRWQTGAVVVAVYIVHVSATGYAQDGFPTVPLLLGVLVWGGTWVVGDRIRSRRERIVELEERALRAERDAERERRLAAAEERTRIARDLHDSAGHAINVILVQAGAARLLSEKDPAGARAAIETIEEVARETVDEIDQLVGALREDGAGAETVEPPPGLAALDTLVSRHRAAGLDVTVHRRGERRARTPGVDQAAYRILQEALTNAARHGSGSADVEVDFGPRALALIVSNPLPAGAASTGTGHGIVGMRERAVLLGGVLEAGVADGRFRVRAELPYSSERPPYGSGLVE
jgi:signal transduction histidine kinase